MHVIFVLIFGYLAIIALVVVFVSIFNFAASGIGVAILVALCAGGLLMRLYRGHQRFALRLQSKAADRRIRRSVRR